MQVFKTSFCLLTSITTIRFIQLVKTIRDAYENFEFLTTYKALVNFINVDLSAFTLTLPKTVVYRRCKSLERRQCKQSSTEAA